ncbi:MAG TPA: PilZ domain-containing protein [Thermodesulfobacteriota bacterium]|nr:PilZ domain-containing protein [Thermodesulfobacteriota bacterium]
MENGHSNGKEIKLGQLTQEPDEDISVLRRSTRIPYYTRLKYSLINSKNEEENDVHMFPGSTFNISEHGIGMEGTMGFPPNFKIHATLYTGAKTIKFEGTIKWLYHSNSEKWYMGVEFSSRRDELREIYATLSETSNFGL